jgi:hypothetical protein
MKSRKDGGLIAIIGEGAGEYCAAIDANKEKLAAGRKYLRGELRRLKSLDGQTITRIKDVVEYTKTALRVLDGKPAAKTAKTKTKGTKK